MDDFIEYVDVFFVKIVLLDNCSFWYNGGWLGFCIYGLWFGSVVYVIRVRRDLCWEDYDYEYLDKEQNWFWWYLGNGFIVKEFDLEVDIILYFKILVEIDLRIVYEGWWDFLQWNVIKVLVDVFV